LGWDKVDKKVKADLHEYEDPTSSASDTTLNSISFYHFPAPPPITKGTIVLVMGHLEKSSSFQVLTKAIFDSKHGEIYKVMFQLKKNSEVYSDTPTDLTNAQAITMVPGNQ
jgi:hypothetical protein